MISALGYHDVVHGSPEESGFTNVEARQYKLDWPSFVTHLDRIAERAAGAPLVAGELRGAGRGAWALTFDDGGACSVEVAEELARRGWKGHFFVTTGRIGTPGFLDEDGVRRVAELGQVIGTHTVSHPNMTSIASWDALVEEWRASADTLAGILSAPVVSGSVPGGWFSPRVAAAAAAAGLELLFTSEPVRRIREVDGCLVAGRHSIRRGDSPATAAAAAAGSSAAWNRQRAGWYARKVLKRVAGRPYAAARRAWITRGS